MMLDYINEAFKSLDLLTEDVFRADSEGIDELSDFMDSDDNTEEAISIIDMDAESEEDLQDSYIGKVICECDVCHSHVFKDKNAIVIDEDGSVNIEEECPYCGENNGFVIIGEIQEFNPNAEEEAAEETNEVSEEPTEEADDEASEFEEVEEEEVLDESLDLIPAIAARFTKSQLDNLTAEEIKILKGHDREAINKVIAKYNSKKKESLDEESLNESITLWDELVKSYPELEESLNESFNNVSIETDDQKMTMTSEDNGKVTVTTEPVEVTPISGEGEMLAPISDETQDEIINATAKVTEEEPTETEDSTEETPDEEEELDFDFDELDEEGMDDLGESYLRRVYENVDSFKTSNVSTSGNKLFIEGMINFKSGVSKKTGFIFEAKEATRDGKVKFIGENAHLCRGKRAFTLNGNIANKKLMIESLTYNYRAKNTSGKSTRVYGKVDRNK